MDAVVLVDAVAERAFGYSLISWILPLLSGEIRRELKCSDAIYVVLSQHC